MGETHAGRRSKTGLLGSVRYELGEVIGEGGMARVHLATARAACGFERRVVIKRLHTHLLADEGAVARFTNEARLQSLVHHANVVGVHDTGTDEAGYFMVLDWVDGGSLRSLAQRAARGGRALAPRVVARIVTDALRGLEAIHDARDGAGRPLGVLHRDVTPGNVLIGTDGLARITDFGIAKSTGARPLTPKTTVIGKMLFMSPEYLRREDVGRASDVYAMGMTAWVTMAGANPWPCDSRGGLMAIIASQRVPELDASLGVDAAVGAVIQRACSPDAAQRFASAAEMADALETAALAAGALASQREVGDVVRALRREATAAALAGDTGARNPWEQRGLSESVWREEAPTGLDGTPSSRPEPVTPRW